MKSKELSRPGTLVVRYAPRDVRARLQQQAKETELKRCG